jgi:glycolate oxidase iron-sulfur subunit
MIDLFPPAQFDAIITNSGGCGNHLRHYSALLAGDPVYAPLAKLWDSKLRDIHEWMMEHGCRAPRTGLGDLTVTYHDSCHLTHGQKVTKQPRDLLKLIPGLKLVELPEANWCCGSAGIYNITQPEQSERNSSCARSGTSSAPAPRSSPPPIPDATCKSPVASAKPAHPFPSSNP